jgi:hypothetical protein
MVAKPSGLLMSSLNRCFGHVASNRWGQAAVILIVAVALSFPCLFYGIPNGATARTHVDYQHHFSDEFWNGQLYPKWLSGANKGYGSPVFLVQYPLPYFVTALIRPFTSFSLAERDARELGIFVSLVLAASGFAAWLWLRKLTDPLAATLAAAVYMAMPYVLDEGLYGRAAVGELSTFIWMPLALWCCESMYSKPAAVFGLSAALALLLLSNLLAAVLFAPALVAYVAVVGKFRQMSWLRQSFLLGLAGILGAGMAGVYLVPMFYLSRLFDLGQLAAHLSGYQLGLYFLQVPPGGLTGALGFATAGLLVLAGIAAYYIVRAQFSWGMRSAMLLTIVLGGLALLPNLGPTVVRASGFLVPAADLSDFSSKMLLALLFTLLLGFVAFCRVALRNTGPREVVLLCMAGVAFLLMLPFSAPVWKAVPHSDVIQFPFRLGGILTVAVIGLVALAIHAGLQHGKDSPLRIPSTLVLGVALFATLVGGLVAWRTDRAFRKPSTANFDLAQDVDPMYRTYVTPDLLPAVARDLGAMPDSYAVRAMAGDGTLRSRVLSGKCDVDVKPALPSGLEVLSDCSNEACLEVGQLYSTLWTIVPAKGQRSTIGVSPKGLLTLTLPAGKGSMRLVFDPGPAQTWGNRLSILSLLINVVGALGFTFLR